MEPPIKTTPEGPELEPRKIGHRWIDLILAGSAILISVVSVSIAMHHSHVQEELVAANSWPFLRFVHGNRNDAGEDEINLALANPGMGPALLKSINITYDGRPVRTRYEFMSACCGYADLSSDARAQVMLVSSPLEHAVIPAGEELLFLSLKPSGDRTVWNRLNSERWKLKFDACYCSVLHACWRSDLTGQEPERVDHCEVDEATNFRE